MIAVEAKVNGLETVMDTKIKGVEAAFEARFKQIEAQLNDNVSVRSSGCGGAGGTGGSPHRSNGNGASRSRHVPRFVEVKKCVTNWSTREYMQSSGLKG